MLLRELCGEEASRGSRPSAPTSWASKLGDRHGRGRAGGHRRLLPGQPGDEVAEVTCGERVVGRKPLALHPSARAR
jgi:hypothetical protein